MGLQSNGDRPAVASTVTVTFTPDGQMQLSVEGDAGPPKLWAAARLIELWGDSEFTAQQLANAEAQQRPADGGRIVNPFGGRKGGS